MSEKEIEHYSWEYILGLFLVYAFVGSLILCFAVDHFYLWIPIVLTGLFGLGLLIFLFIMFRRLKLDNQISVYGVCSSCKNKDSLTYEPVLVFQKGAATNGFGWRCKDCKDMWSRVLNNLDLKE